MNTMLKFSQLNGLIGDIFNGISTFFTNFFSLLVGKLMIEVYHLLVIPVFALMDGIQLMFRKFAGLDTYKINGSVQSGDIVLTLINNPTVQNVFWSLIILAVVLLIITTIVALIRAQTQTSADKDRKSNNQIFVSSLKALVNFFMVPVVAILGIFMGNALLKSLDKATSGENNIRMSAMVFTTCAYESNRARLSEKFAHDLAVDHVNNMGVLNGTTEEIADVVDQAFKNGTTFTATSFDISKNASNLFSEKVGDYFYLVTFTLWSAGTAYIPRTQFSVYDMWQVFYYYDLVSFNYLFFLIAGFFVCWVLLSTSIGLVKRMFKLIILLVISPPIAALMPIDNGVALGKWRKQFIGSTLSAYATVVALNLTLMLLGPISQIDFFYYSETYTGLIPTAFNQVAQLLILCGALYFFKDITKVLSEMVGAENAYEDGGKVTQDIAKKVSTGALVAAGLAGAVPAKAAAKKLLQAGLGKKAKLTDANKNLEDAKSNYDKVKNLGNNNRKKIEAKNKLEEAKQAQESAQKDYDKNQESVKSYEKLAKDRLGLARSNFASLATNGMSDSFEGIPTKLGKTTVSDDAKAAYKQIKTEKRKENIAKAKAMVKSTKGVVKKGIDAIKAQPAYFKAMLSDDVSSWEINPSTDINPELQQITNDILSGKSKGTNDDSKKRRENNEAKRQDKNPNNTLKDNINVGILKAQQTLNKTIKAAKLKTKQAIKAAKLKTKQTINEYKNGGIPQNVEQSMNEVSRKSKK